METNKYLQVPGQGYVDKYTEHIELSNACREFYRSRIQAKESAENERVNRLDNNNTVPSKKPDSKKTSIDLAMEHLRSEMATLMDQDLSLMKQLLTLNEAIEDLKWQRRYSCSKTSLLVSSCDIEENECSVSETDIFEESYTDVRSRIPNISYPGYSKSKEIRTQVEENKYLTQRDINDSNKQINQTTNCYLETEINACDQHGKICHIDQNSFDSGIHEAEFVCGTMV